MQLEVPSLGIPGSLAPRDCLLFFSAAFLLLLRTDGHFWKEWRSLSDDFSLRALRSPPSRGETHRIPADRSQPRPARPAPAGGRRPRPPGTKPREGTEQ